MPTIHSVFGTSQKAPIGIVNSVNNVITTGFTLVVDTAALDKTAGNRLIACVSVASTSGVAGFLLGLPTQSGATWDRVPLSESKDGNSDGGEWFYSTVLTGGEGDDVTFIKGTAQEARDMAAIVLEVTNMTKRRDPTRSVTTSFGLSDEIASGEMTTLAGSLVTMAAINESDTITQDSVDQDFSIFATVGTAGDSGGNGSNRLSVVDKINDGYAAPTVVMSASNDWTSSMVEWRDAYGTYEIVQVLQTDNGGSSGTFTVSLNSTPLNGSILIMMVFGDDASSGGGDQNVYLSSVPAQTGVSWRRVLTNRHLVQKELGMEWWVSNRVSGAARDIDLVMENASQDCGVQILEIAGITTDKYLEYVGSEYGPAQNDVVAGGIGEQSAESLVIVGVAHEDGGGTFTSFTPDLFIERAQGNSGGATTAFMTGAIYTAVNTTGSTNNELKATSDTSDQQMGMLLSIQKDPVPFPVVQAAGRGNATGSTILIVVIDPPTNGNTLFMVIGTRDNDATDVVTSITHPNANWIRLVQGAQGTTTISELWVAHNVQNVGGTLTLNLVTSTDAGAVIIEVEGLPINEDISPDGYAVATGQGTVMTTGEVNVQSSTQTLMIAGIGEETGAIPSFGLPTNGYTQIFQVAGVPASSTGFTMSMLMKVVTTPGNTSGGLTSGDLDDWVGVIGAFKKLDSPRPPLGIVQTLATNNGGSDSSFDVTLDSAPLDGSILVMMVFADDVGTATDEDRYLSTAPGHGGTTWRCISSRRNMAQTALIQEWWVTDKVSSAIDTISLTLDGTGDCGVHVLEISGIRDNKYLEYVATTFNGGASTSPRGGEVGIPSKESLMICGICVETGSKTISAPTNDFEERMQGDSGGTDSSFMNGAIFTKIGSTAETSVTATIGSSDQALGTILNIHATEVPFEPVQWHRAGVTSGTTISSTMPAAPTDGNTLFMVLGGREGVFTTVASSIDQDNVGWVKLAVADEGSIVTELWAARNVQNAGTGITVNLVDSGDDAVFVLVEIEGIAATGDISPDGYGTATGSGTAQTTGSVTVSDTVPSLVIAGIAQENSNQTLLDPTDDFTLAYQYSNSFSTGSAAMGIVMLMKVATSTGTVSSGITAQQSDNWAGVIGSFKS